MRPCPSLSLPEVLALIALFTDLENSDSPSKVIHSQSSISCRVGGSHFGRLIGFPPLMELGDCRNTPIPQDLFFHTSVPYFPYPISGGENSSTEPIIISEVSESKMTLSAGISNDHKISKFYGLIYGHCHLAFAHTE